MQEITITDKGLNWTGRENNNIKRSFRSFQFMNCIVKSYSPGFV